MNFSSLKPSAVLDALPNPTLLLGEEEALSVNQPAQSITRKQFFCMICKQDIQHHDSAYQHWLQHERARVARRKHEKERADG